MTKKERILAVIQTLPDDVSIDQAIDRLYLLQKINRGIQQADAGELTDHEEFMNELLAEDEED